MSAGRGIQVQAGRHTVVPELDQESGSRQSFDVDHNGAFVSVHASGTPCRPDLHAGHSGVCSRD
jgi:hypothetical protein